MANDSASRLPRRGVEERVSSVETELHSLSGQFREHRAAVESRLDSIFSRLSDLRVPNVSTWIAFAGLAIAGSAIMVTIGMGVMAAFASGFIRDLDRVDAEQKALVVRVNSYIEDLNPNQVVKNSTENRENISKLDEALQREMRMLNDTTAGQLEALDERLQREMELREKGIWGTIRMNHPEMKNGGP